jgi:hypothetical protein
VQIFSQVEDEIRDFVSREAVVPQRVMRDCIELTRGNIGLLSADAVQEIDRSVTELETLRRTLQNETTRVRRDIMRFAALNQASRASMRTISEKLHLSEGSN